MLDLYLLRIANQLIPMFSLTPPRQRLEDIIKLHEHTRVNNTKRRKGNYDL